MVTNGERLNEKMIRNKQDLKDWIDRKFDDSQSMYFWLENDEVHIQVKNCKVKVSKCLFEDYFDEMKQNYGTIIKSYEGK